MGRNGMGKTTLIKTMLGLVRPREGRCGCAATT
jgi:ABC-type multidrug transport system ATPase subunit